MATDLAQPIPRTLDGALDPAWLSTALTPISGGARVERVEVVDAFQINQTIKSTIVRFRAHFDDGTSAGLCLKGYLDREGHASSSAVRESRFYTDLAPRLPVRRPELAAAPLDAEAQFGIVIMRDMIERGAHFCSALEPFDAARTARSLEQLALLHTAPRTLGPVGEIGWTSRQIDWLAGYLKADFIQTLLDDQRGVGLTARTRDATLLLEGLKALSAEDASRPATLIHGDCHAGNIFETAEGAGLIDFELVQQGGWALDVAYHVAATLPVEVAEREERNLLRHYLDTARGLGGDPPGEEEAWRQYRMSAIYGFFLWAITRTVKREIIDVFTARLGASVTRHESYKLLGL
jgi:aminoglycoside phosphotransferase (APT) family kinase protein